MDADPHDHTRSRLYGVPESTAPRASTSDRLELFVDQDDWGRVLEDAVDRIFADPAAAAEFQHDPRAFLIAAGMPDVAARWDSIELQVSVALGDTALHAAAVDGDVERFVDRLQQLGLVPASFDMLDEPTGAMGFTVIPLGFVAVLGVLVVVGIGYSAAVVVVTALAWVSLAAVVASQAVVVAETLALSQANIILNTVVETVIRTEIWVGGPGGDNPDESADVSTPVSYLPNLNSPHVARLMQQTLDVDLLRRMAAHLHNDGFGAEVTEEIVKRALFAVWERYTTGYIAEPGQDRHYLDIVQALATPEVVEQLPELTSVARYAMLANGVAAQTFELMVRLREPVRLAGIDFNPRDLLMYQKVLIVPTGALYGLDASESFHARLEEYVRLGGICICMAQQHGYDFAALPGGLEGYGWNEDQSCHARSVVITAPHPGFSGQDSDVLDVSIDGFFTAWPDGSHVLLRRRINGQPALLTYPYGDGRVVVTSAYADWGVGSNQLTRDERLLMRDLFTWARLSANDVAVAEFDPDETPFHIAVAVTNPSADAAQRIVFHAVDPDKNLIRDRATVEVAIETGQTREVELEISDLTALGHWSLDAELQDALGEAIHTEYEAAAFVVNNFDETLDGVGYKAEPISFSAVADEERMLRGQRARIRLLVWNYAPTVRVVTVRTTMPGLPPETRVVQLPPGRRTEVQYLSDPLTDVRPHAFHAHLSDESGRSLGSATKVVYTQDPAVDLVLAIDKDVYRPGERIEMSLAYANTIRAAFDASFAVAITDPSGAILFDERFDASLRPGIPGSRSFAFVLPLSVRYGTFKVWAEAATAERRLAYREEFFTPALKGRLEGKVVDTVTGAPAVGALVQIDGGPQVTVAADTGAYSFSADAGGHWLTVAAPGYGPTRAYTVIAPERVAQIADIHLSPLVGGVQGVVVDAVTNEPIEGARVTPDNAAAVTVDADGVFAVELPRGERGLATEATGYLPGSRLGLQVYPSRVSRVSALFLVPTRGRVRGVARRADTGEPLPGAEILSRQQVVAAADADGAFELTFATGQRDLEVRAPGYGSCQLTVYVPAGRAVEVDDVLLVPRFGAVAGLIYDSASREPIAGARVTVASREVPPAVTGPDGRFHLRLRAQNQSLDIEAIGYGGTSIGFSLPAAKTLDGLDLGLVSLVGRIGGVVVSTADDLPVAGARVADGAGAVSFTGDDGEFALTTAVRTNRLTVEAPGHAPLDVEADVYAGRTTRLEKVYLARLQGSVTGRLIDSATGTPIVAGRVWVDRGAETRTSADGTFDVASAVGHPRLGAEAYGYQPLNGVIAEVHSGRASSVGDLPLAALAGVVAGRVQAADGSGVPDIVVSADQRVREELPSATIVSGKVVDRRTGEPVGGARVQAGDEPVRFTDADGRVELALPAGLHRVAVDAPSYRRFDHSLRVDAGFAAKLDQIELVPVSGRVSGRVANAVTGQPIARAKVWTHDRPDVWTLADAEGRYALELPAGEVTLRASAADHGAHGGMRLDLAAGHTIAAPDLLLAQMSAWVEGVVRNAVTGEPIPAALVQASDTEGTSTDADGSFRLRLASGTRTVSAMASGHRGQAQATVRLAEGTASRLDALALFPGDAELRGVVCSALDGQPLTGIRVWADDDLDEGVVTGVDGSFTLHVAPGAHRIQAQAAGYAGVASADLPAVPGRTTVADLLHLVPAGASAPAQGAGVASGRLLGAIDGEPIADTLVWWDDANLALGALHHEGRTRTSGAAPYLGTHAIAGDAGWSDLRLRVSALPGDNGGWGVLLRYVDEQNHYRFMWVNDPAAGGPVRRLERVVAGERSVLAEDVVNYPPSRWTTIEAVADGDLISIAVGGRVAMQVRDATHAAGRIGLAVWSQSHQYFRAISVVGSAGTLFEERHTDGLAAWTIVDAGGAAPPSRWSMIAPTAVRTGADGSFRFDALPLGRRTLFMDPQSPFMTPWGDNRLGSLTSYAGRRTDATLFAMPRTCTFAGTLGRSPDGLPEPGVRVRERLTGRTAVTGADGTFEPPATGGRSGPEALRLRRTHGERRRSAFRGAARAGKPAARWHDAATGHGRGRDHARGGRIGRAGRRSRDLLRRARPPARWLQPPARRGDPRRQSLRRGTCGPHRRAGLDGRGRPLRRSLRRSVRVGRPAALRAPSQRLPALLPRAGGGRRRRPDHARAPRRRGLDDACRDPPHARPEPLVRGALRGERLDPDRRARRRAALRGAGHDVDRRTRGADRLGQRGDDAAQRDGHRTGRPGRRRGRLGGGARVRLGRRLAGRGRRLDRRSGGSGRHLLPLRQLRLPPSGARGRVSRRAHVRRARASAGRAAALPGRARRPARRARSRPVRHGGVPHRDEAHVRGDDAARLDTPEPAAAGRKRARQLHPRLARAPAGRGGAAAVRHPLRRPDRPPAASGDHGIRHGRRRLTAQRWPGDGAPGHARGARRRPEHLRPGHKLLSIRPRSRSPHRRAALRRAHRDDGRAAGVRRSGRRVGRRRRPGRGCRCRHAADVSPHTCRAVRWHARRDRVRGRRRFPDDLGDRRRRSGGGRHLRRLRRSPRPPVGRCARVVPAPPADRACADRRHGHRAILGPPGGDPRVPRRVRGLDEHRGRRRAGAPPGRSRADAGA